MQKWEHGQAFFDGTRSFKFDNGGKSVKEYPVNGVMELLNLLGNEGWELVGVNPPGYFLMKRPKN